MAKNRDTARLYQMLFFSQRSGAYYL